MVSIDRRATLARHFLHRKTHASNGCLAASCFYRSGKKRIREFMRIMPVDESNYRKILQLKVLPSQQDFIENIVECLQNAEDTNLCRVVGLYEAGDLVGFGMYGLMYDAAGRGEAWLENFMIDSSYQGHGYGEQALNLLLDAIENEYSDKSDDIYLSVNPSNSRAIGLYKNHGFEFNGKTNQYDERIMVKPIFAHALAASY